MNHISQTVAAYIVGATFLITAPHSSALTNADFETPVLGAENFQYFPSSVDAGWVFPRGDGSGITGGESMFTAGNPMGGHGQVAFLQGQGRMMTSVLLTPGEYVVTFSAAARMNYQLGEQTIAVSVGGKTVGIFIPLPGEMQNYSSLTFTVDTPGSYELAFTGTGSGRDYTAFIDDVAISRVTAISLKTDVSEGVADGALCNASLAEFHTGFELAKDPSRAGIWVRHMDSAHNNIIAHPSWYDASVNTLVPNDGCARGPHDLPTAPHDLAAQSTVQMRSNEVGFLLLSRDAKDSMNAHAMYGWNDIPDMILPWKEKDDALYVEAEMRMTMANISHNSSAYTPVGQFYVAFNATDTTSPAEKPKVIEFSVAAYDSRAPGYDLGCDHYAGADGQNAVIETAFSVSDVGCLGPKIMWVPSDSGHFTAGHDLPAAGAWYTYKPFKARITKEALARAIRIANERLGGFNPDPSVYALSAFGVIQEMIWFDPLDAIDMASSFRNVRASLQESK